MNVFVRIAVEVDWALWIEVETEVSLINIVCSIEPEEVEVSPLLWLLIKVVLDLKIFWASWRKCDHAASSATSESRLLGFENREYTSELESDTYGKPIISARSSFS